MLVGCDSLSFCLKSCSQFVAGFEAEVVSTAGVLDTVRVPELLHSDGPVLVHLRGQVVSGSDVRVPGGRSVKLNISEVVVHSSANTNGVSLNSLEVLGPREDALEGVSDVVSDLRVAAGTRPHLLEGGAQPEVVAVLLEDSLNVLLREVFPVVVKVETKLVLVVNVEVLLDSVLSFARRFELSNRLKQ